MKKTDAIISVIIGFFIGISLFIILKSMGKEIPYSWLVIIVFPPLSLLGMFIVSILGKRYLIISQAGKFILMGGAATLIDFGILNFLMGFTKITEGVVYSVFVGTSFIVATVIKYFGDKFWAFEKMEKEGMGKEFSQFFVVTLIGGGIHIGIASILVNYIGPQFGLSSLDWANIGKIGGVISAFAWNFLGYKFIVFKK